MNIKSLNKFVKAFIALIVIDVALGLYILFFYGTAGLPNDLSRLLFILLFTGLTYFLLIFSTKVLESINKKKSMKLILLLVFFQIFTLNTSIYLSSPEIRSIWHVMNPLAEQERIEGTWIYENEETAAILIFKSDKAIYGAQMTLDGNVEEIKLGSYTVTFSDEFIVWEKLPKSQYPNIKTSSDELSYSERTKMLDKILLTVKNVDRTRSFLFRRADDLEFISNALKMDHKSRKIKRFDDIVGKYLHQPTN